MQRKSSKAGTQLELSEVPTFSTRDSIKYIDKLLSQKNGMHVTEDF